MNNAPLSEPRPMTAITIDVSAYQAAFGCEPRGKRPWQWEIGTETFAFDGKFYEGRRAAIERAATLGASRIALCAKCGAPSLPAKPAEPIETKPAEPVRAKPVIANVENDATLDAIFAAKLAANAEPPATAPQLEIEFRMVEFEADDA